MTPIIHRLFHVCLFLFFVKELAHRSVGQPVSNILLQDLTVPSQCSEPRIAADPNQPLGMIFASCRNGNGIVAINGTRVWTIVPSSVPGCPNPSGMAVHAGVLYATCFVTGRSDPETPTAVRVNFTSNDWIVSTVLTFKECAGASRLEIDRLSGRVYVLCSQSIIVLDGASVSSLVPYDMCHFPSAVFAASFSGGREIYVGCSTDKSSFSPQPSRLLAVNSITGNVTVLVDFDVKCQNPMKIIPDSISGTLYVVCYGDARKNKGSVVSVHGTNVSTLLAGDVCSAPTTGVFDPVSGFLFCNCGILKTVAFHPASPASTLTTLVDSSRCEHSQSMVLVPQEYPSTPAQVSLLVGCRNSDVVLLVTAAMPVLVSDPEILTYHDTKFVTSV